ncbi:MAG: diadenylate cyclase CdaA [Vicinamibacterales bacterium]
MTWLTSLLEGRTVSWRDLVDIGIVAVLLYQVLLLIRGTRAAQMVLTSAAIVALFYLSEFLGLETVNWLIRFLVPYVVFALIVLFQADIRRALTLVGRMPFLRRLARFRNSMETVEEIVVAAAGLSAKRLGGIIVIERQIGLRNYMEGGIPLDARVTYDLLSCIFLKESSLHDGAVIIQGERIAAAACVLPLSVNPAVAKTLGTRHRAAIGITEENDSVAVVCSEETGVISIALKGTLERDFTADTLRDRLTALLRSGSSAAPAVDEEGVVR